MATSGQIMSFRNLCEKSQFEVPDFQRNYSWQTEQIGEFHSDIKNALKKEISHFIGSTILMSKTHSPKTNTYLIIDGQQRFTTIFMYVAIIRDLVNSLPNEFQTISDDLMPSNPLVDASRFIFRKVDSKWEPKFQSNYLLRKFFFEHVLAQKDLKPMPIKHKYWTLDLRNAYKHIKNLFEEDLKQFSHPAEELKYLNGFLNTIFDLSILTINTTEYTESFDVFMTLNNRGMNLGPSDLVKSLFMKYGSEDLTNPSDVEAVNNQIQNDWKSLTDTLGENNENSDPDVFLRHYLVSELKDPVQAKRIFTEVENIVLNKKRSDNITQLTPKIESKNLLNRLIEKSQIYAQLSDPLTRITDNEIAIRSHKLVFLFDTVKILLLKILDPEIYLTTEQRRELLRICEALSLRWLIINGNAQQLENIFQDACTELRKENLHFSEVVKILTEKMPSDSAVKPQFYAEINKPNLVKIVFHTINSVIYDKSGLVKFDSKLIQLEHIVPQNPEKWIDELYPETSDGREVKYSSLCENWGNKTILDFKINASIKDERFEVKKNGIVKSDGKKEQGYKDSHLKITVDLSNFAKWSEKEIELRNRWIGETFTKIWCASPDVSQIQEFSKWELNQPSPNS
jgi:uncharacterized protein with ParB-like and HNH nuclease domain